MKEWDVNHPACLEEYLNCPTSVESSYHVEGKYRGGSFPNLLDDGGIADEPTRGCIENLVEMRWGKYTSGECIEKEGGREDQNRVSQRKIRNSLIKPGKSREKENRDDVNEMDNQM